jgi:ABC-type transport system involved in cytochrome c biogenesis permease subunit
MLKPRTSALKILRLLGGPKLATWVLLWLMVLLVLGTLAQTHMGLYQAQLKYFASMVLWLGPVPTPGGALTLLALGVGLSLRMIIYPWKWAHAGSLLAHLAVWLLLVGGLVTALTLQEGYMQITEGQTQRVMESYHTPELAVINPSGTTLLHHPVTALQPNARLQLGDKILRVEKYFPNSLLTERPAPIEDALTKGARRFFEFTRKTMELDDERNRPTLLFTIEDTAQKPLAKLVLFQHQPVPQPWPMAAEPSATLVLRPMQTPLPFAVQLKRFEAEYHPGTLIARHYASVVEIESAGSGPNSSTWPATIRMNAPLRYGGYTLYQSSFMGSNAALAAGQASNLPQTSILAVVKNQGYMVPYLAGILLCIGLLLHGILRWRKLLVLALLMPLWIPQQSHANTSPTLSLHTFGLLPVQHEGRIKPLKSYAEITMVNLSGVRMPLNQPALQTLAQIIFTPETAKTERLFTIPSLALAERLQLPVRSPRRYSYTELVPALQPHFGALQTIAATPRESRDPLDAQLLQLADKIQLFYLLSQSGVTGATASLSPLKIHPPRLGEELWLAPLAAPQSPYQTTWAAMAAAYQSVDTQLWATATQAAWRLVGQQPTLRPLALRAEVYLRALHPFPLATALFVLAFALAVWRCAPRLAWAVLAAGAAISCTALAARVYILQRPPVGTLYESIVFVGCVAVVVALAAAWRKGAYQQRWLVVGAGVGLAVQGLGVRYAATQADTLGVLVAVLDTSFWLATHVLVITAGYGLALLAALWAHAMLIANLRHPKAFKASDVQRLNLLIIWALALTATGTLLGGIWADQSWGRFWGWDPKENGALLLTLWLAWLLHARMAGVIGALGLVACTALTSCIVAVAWFGVNLLGVGLHSYGFTENGLTALLGFVLLELVLVAALVYRLRNAAR